MSLVKDIFSKTYHDTQAFSEIYQSENGKSTDKKVLVICIFTALCLTMNKYLPEMRMFFLFSDNEQLSQLANWVFVLCIFYFVIPVLIVKLYFKENLSDYGLKWKGAFKEYWIYLVMLGVMIPLVAFFSTTKSFQARY